MKTCAYCGTQYPDDAITCPLDGESLAGSSEQRKKVTGVWRGAYGYDHQKKFSDKVVLFTLKLKQGWLGHFTGTVTEDAPLGAPGTGTIDGYFGLPAIEFTKQMPVGYIVNPDGSRATLRERFTADGHPCENELPGPPISYEGTFLDANRIQGPWVIMPRSLRLPDGWSVNLAQSTGIWCAEFITADLNANPTDGPKEPFFDKTLIPQRDETTAESVAFRPLGKFTVADAEKSLQQFETENIRFEINQDDSAVTEMMPITAVSGGRGGTGLMIEIFVHPDDEARALAIVTSDQHV